MPATADFPSNFVMAQGGCYMTGTAADLVWTGMNIEGEGALMLCRSAILDLADAAGYQLLPKEELERLRDDLTATLADLRATQARLDRANDLVNEVGLEAMRIAAEKDNERRIANAPQPRIGGKFAPKVSAR